MSDFKFISSFPSLEPIPCFLATTVLLLIDRIMSHSFQLPDLLGIINCLELRTNRFCPFATDTSEKWFFEEITTGNNNNNNNNNSSCIIIISPAELSYLRSTKLGLLAALCFPTCDAPQLRLLTDFLTMLFYSHIRALSSSTTTPSQTLVGHSSLSDSMIQAMWNTATTTDSESATANGRESGLDILENHVLFKHVINPRITRLVPTASNTWKSRFSQSVQLYKTAQTKMIQQNHHSENNNNNITVIPTLEEYLELGRELNGFSMILDLSEILEITQFPELQGEHAEKLLELKNTAFDVIAWSMDVTSYQFDLAKGNKHNLVAILMHHKNISLQGAVNLAGNMIKDAFATFRSLEHSLLKSVDPKKGGAAATTATGLPPIFSWKWTSLLPPSHNNNNSSSETFNNNETQLIAIQNYITRLKDCIVGTVNWLYETELYFGKKGSEIRTFGWVFINPIAVD